MWQRVLENEAKGMSIRAAIEDAEHHIPNYRVPSEVANSHFVSQMIRSPIFFMFGRYRYGQIMSHARLIKALAIGTPKQRFDAVGSLLIGAVMLTVLWPAINYGIQKLTGDKKLKFGPKGPLTIPQDLLDMYNGDKDLVQGIAGLVTLSPLLEKGLETFPFNKDSFTGKPIAEPADLRKMARGSIKSAGRVGAAEAEHAAGLVQPYALMDQAFRSSDPVWKTIAKSAFGLRGEPKPGRARVYRRQEKEAVRRKPQGLIEEGERKLEKALRYGGTQ